MSKWFVRKTKTRSPSRRSFFSTSGDSQLFLAATFLTVVIIVLGPTCARADVDDVKLVGDDQADRTASGLWPFGRPGLVKRDRDYVAPVSPAAPQAVLGSGILGPTGRSWTQQTTSGVRAWNGIACDATCTKLVAVATGESGELVYTSTDSGATWTGQTGSLLAGYMGVASSSDGTHRATPNRRIRAFHFAISEGCIKCHDQRLRPRKWPTAEAATRVSDRLDELEGASRHSRTTHDQAHLRPH